MSRYNSRHNSRPSIIGPDWTTVVGLGAVGVVLAGAIITSNDGPDCSGEQRVPVTEGSTVQNLMTQEIDVTNGYVDFNGVSFHVERPQTDGTMRDMGKITAVLPDDTVVMPKTCKE